ncbi:ArsR/SmtB family transcription factor [Bacteroidota bacterium]
MINFDQLKSIFQTLSDSNRLKILHRIADKEVSVGELVNESGLSQPLVSHHLRVMKENGILDTKRKGPFVFYFIGDQKLLYAINLFQELAQKEIKTPFCPEWIQKKYNKNK